MQIDCETIPQQDVEKKSEFNAAATPPAIQANGDKRFCRKQSHALRPRKSNPIGAATLEYHSVPSIQTINVLK